MERGRISKPKYSESDPVVYFKAEDLYVGTRVQFYKHKFIFFDVDEYTLRYMEKNEHQVYIILIQSMD